MNNKIFKTIIASLAIAALILPGCKKFLDINENPNATKTAGVAQILPSIELAVGHVVSYQYQNFGSFWAQYWTQGISNSQFRGLDRYNVGPNDFDRPWGILYANALLDTDSLIMKENQNRYAQYAAIAYILRAYSYQLLTDAFGDVPMSEALAGGANTSPKYDAQSAVYDSIFLWIEKGKALMDPDSDYTPGTDDILGGGDMEYWNQVANTLKLRAYLRISRVDEPKARAGIAALFAENDFLTTGLIVPWTTAGGNQNPLYAETLSLGTINQRASATAVNAMKSNNDKRVRQYYSLVADEVVPIVQGGFDTADADVTRSRPANRVYSTSAQGVLISAAESYFLQAEAVSQGFATGNAQNLYIAGVRASFVASGLTAADADAYLADPLAVDAKWPADAVNQKRIIITQKYYAMTGNQGFEAWSEWRRTGYPDFLVTSATSILPDGVLPQRFIYPQSELTRNAKFPGLKKIEERVWWALP